MQKEIFELFVPTSGHTNINKPVRMKYWHTREHTHIHTSAYLLSSGFEFPVSVSEPENGKMSKTDTSKVYLSQTSHVSVNFNLVL